MWDVLAQDVGHWRQGMYENQDVGFSGKGMLGMWNVDNAKS